MLLAVLLASGLAGPSDRAEGAPRGEPATSLAGLAEDYARAEKDLLRRCEIDGHRELGVIIDAWRLPAAGDRQQAFVIPAAIETPACIDSDGERSIWADFLAARRARAAGLFEHARFAAGAYERQPTRAELARPPADVRPLPQRSCEAVRLLYATLREDPDHERARAAAGWVRRGDAWVWPEADRHRDRGEEYDPSFGWMTKGTLARHREGLRYRGGRWIAAADDEASLREVRRGRQFAGDHWEIVTTAPPVVTGEVASALEATRLVWLQIFGGFALEPADLEKRLAGRSRLRPQPPHSAILCGSREQYLSELGRLEPRIGIASGIYWQPTATIWFFADPAGPPSDTVRHEGFHQLFAESRLDFMSRRVEPGRRCGFWSVEAAALYGESIEKATFGWTIGGRHAGRGPAARQLLADGFFVPLSELAALGREAFQADPRLALLYDQCGGLADFFMNGQEGRYREPFVEYLARVYTGTVSPDTLARLCGRSYPELDAEYKAYVVAVADREEAKPAAP